MNLGYWIMNLVACLFTSLWFVLAFWLTGNYRASILWAALATFGVLGVAVVLFDLEGEGSAFALGSSTAMLFALEALMLSGEAGDMFGHPSAGYVLMAISVVLGVCALVFAYYAGHIAFSIEYNYSRWAIDTFDTLGFWSALGVLGVCCGPIVFLKETFPWWRNRML